MIRGMKLIVLLALGVVCNASAPAAEPDSAAEKRLCASKPTPMTALLRASTQARAVPPRQRVALQLAPEKTVMLPGTSEDLRRSREKARGATFAGIVRMHVTRPGAYRIGVDRDAWLDIATEGGRLVDPAPDEATFECDGVQKVLVYQLPAAGTYWLQIALSPRRETWLTVIPAD